MSVKSVLSMQADSAGALQEALDIASRLSPGNVSQVEVTIKGEIRLEKALRVQGNAVPIRIKGENGILDGGFRVTGFQPVRINGVEAWRAPIDRAYGERLQFDQLFVNGSRRFRPQFPEEKPSGFCGLAEEPDGSLREMVKDDWITSNKLFRYRGQLPEFAHPEELELHVMHCWLHERAKIASLDPEHNLIRTEAGTRFCVLDHEYCALVNVFECLKKPGQYYYDRRECCLYYIPTEGENIETAEVVIPLADALLQFADCEDVEVLKLAFRYVSGRCDYRETVQREETPERFVTETQRQGECEMGGCIQFVDCRDCRVSRCGFEHLGAYGVDIVGVAQDIFVEHCAFTDMGSGALKTQHDDEHGVHMTGIRFADNTVNGYGTAYHAACAVLLAQAAGGTVENNDISDGEYTAISCGWTWGYENIGYYGNRICGNHLYNIGKNRLDDMGAIYTLGVQPFTVISGNHIHDVISSSPVCFGIYLDEGSSCMTVEGNLVYRVSGDAIRIHYGRDNIVRHNICASCKGALLNCSRKEEHVQIYAMENVFFNENQKMIRIPAGTPSLVSNGNLFFADGKTPLFSRTAFQPEETFFPMEEWIGGTGNDTLSTVEDPGFVDRHAGDYRLRSQSPAAKQYGGALEQWIVR